MLSQACRPCFSQTQAVTQNPTTHALVQPTASQFRSANGLQLGVDIQAYNAALAAVAANTGTLNLSGTTLTLPSSVVGQSNIASGRGLARQGVALSSLSAIAPDYVGQTIVTTDGFYCHATGTSAGNWITDWYFNGTTDVRPLRDFVSTAGNISLTQGYVRAASLAGEHVFSIQSGGSGINVAIIDRPDDGYYSAVQINTAGVERAAFGVGTHTEGSGYADRAFWEFGHIADAADNMDTREGFIAQYANQNVGGLTYYKKQIFRINGDIEFYASEPGMGTDGVTREPTSPLSLFLAGEDGRVGVLTDTLTSGAALTVDGAVSSSQQRWHASKRGGSAQTLPASTWTDVTFSNEEADPFSIFASNTATPTMPGVVHMSVTIFFSNVGSGNQVWGRITKNGTSMIEERYTGSSSSDSHSLSFSYFTTTDGDDTFKVQAYNEAGGDLSGETHFQGWVQ